MSLSFSERGEVRVDGALCTNCGACARICPTETLVINEGLLSVQDVGFMGCIACGHCMMTCPEKAIAVQGRRLSSDDIVEFSPDKSGASWDEFDAMCLSRRSVRRFEDREVEKGVIDRIISSVQTAPMGIPASEVCLTVILGREKVQDFAGDCVQVFDETLNSLGSFALWMIRLFKGKTESDVMRDFAVPLLGEIVERWKKGEDVLCYQAPAALLFHCDPSSDPSDASIATTYAMLAAQSLGLGSCWIGTSVVLGRNQRVKTKWGVPAKNHVPSLLLLGYPREAYRRSVRRRLASVHFA